MTTSENVNRNNHLQDQNPTKIQTPIDAYYKFSQILQDQGIFTGQIF